MLLICSMSIQKIIEVCTWYKNSIITKANFEKIKREELQKIYEESKGRDKT